MSLLVLACLLVPDLVIGPSEVEIPTVGHEGYMRCEPSIGASGKDVVVAWNDSIGGEHGSQSGTAVGWAYSSDAGLTYKVGGYLSGKGGKLDGADSRIATTGDGRFILLVLSGEGIHLYDMSGKQMGTMNDLGLAVGGADLDKPALAVDGKRLAIAYTKGTGEIWVARSADGGRTFDQGVLVSEAVKKNRSGVSLVFDGPALRAAWMEGAGNVATEASVASAPKWDRPFEPAHAAYRLTVSPKAPNGQAMAGYRDGAYGLFHYDTGLNVTRGEVQLSLVEGTKLGSRVLVLRSKNGGKAWGKPIEVSALFPSGSNSYAAVCPLKNEVTVLYYHQEANATDGSTDVIMTSLSQDASFSATVSSQPTPWKNVLGDAKRAPIQRVFGDYISVANNGKDELYAAWTDGRAGGSTIMVRHLTAFPTVRRYR